MSFSTPFEAPAYVDAVAKELEFVLVVVGEVEACYHSPCRIHSDPALRPELDIDLRNIEVGRSPVGTLQLRILPGHFRRTVKCHSCLGLRRHHLHIQLHCYMRHHFDRNIRFVVVAIPSSLESTVAEADERFGDYLAGSGGRPW